MRKKEERFVVTFATTTGAMAMERACAWCGREDIPEARRRGCRGG